jgi:hypothetical protein
MNGRPTLADLRACVFKHSAPNVPHAALQSEVGNWLSRRVGRPSAVYGTWLAVRVGVSANQVTFLALTATMLAALAFGSGTREWFVGGVALAWLAYWLDHIDGQVARWNGAARLDGVYLDYMLHHASAMLLGFSLGYGLAVSTGNLGYAAAGFAMASGWTFLSLQNDCRYKAFFQRLKRERKTYRVDGGAGARPEPPAPWPRGGLGVLTWPAYKACEPHVVLCALLVLGVLAIAAPGVWLLSWKVGVAGMAGLAPLLALGRAARAAARGAVEAEFACWFRANSSRSIPGD